MNCKKLLWYLSIKTKKLEQSIANGRQIGSEEILDGSIRMEDLSKEVTDKLESSYDEETSTLYLNRPSDR